MTTDGTGEGSNLRVAGIRGALGRVEAVQTLRIASFRYFVFSNLLFFFGQQMQLVARQWLLLDLTPSRMLLGMVAFAQGVPILALSPLAGAATDRIPRRNLLMAGQGGQMAVALMMGLLVVTGAVQVWQVILASAVMGIFLAFTQPATQTFVFDIVGRGRLMNALAVNSSATGLAQTSGPALAGLLIASVGVAGTYWVSASGYVFALAMLAAIPAGIQVAVSGVRKTVWQDMREGVAITTRSPVLRWLMALSAITLFAGAINVLRPVYAKDILEVGSSGFGLMSGAFGGGSVLGALTVASLGNVRRKGLVLVTSGLIWYLTTIIYAFSRSFPLTLGLEVLLGVCAQFWVPSMITALQTTVTEEMRGRIMALYFMMTQTIFLGQLLAGTMADFLGDTFTLAMSGAIPVGIYLFVLVKSKAIRDLQ